MLKTKNLQIISRGEAILLEGLLKIKEAARFDSYSDPEYGFFSLCKAILAEYEAEQERVANANRVGSPLRGGNNLRNESTEEARRIWAFVDKAAAKADDAPGEQNVTS